MQLAIVAVGESFFLYYGSRLVDGESTAIKIKAVKLCDGFVRIFRSHGDETEAFRASSIAIRNDADRFHRPNLRKQVGQFVLRRLKRQISNVNFLCHALSCFVKGTSSRACGKGPSY